MIMEEDIDILNSLHYNENAKPGFKIYKSCLVWPDEGLDAPLSRKGRNFLSDLWEIRTFIYQQLPHEKWGVTLQSWKYCTEKWEFGLKNVPNWPGFKRLELSEIDKKYLNRCLDDPEFRKKQIMMVPKMDIDILNALHYDENTKPNFEFFKACLTWRDEGQDVPLSSEGREFLVDLWITRSCIHRQLPHEKWGLDPQSWQYFTKIWEFGLKNVPNWPGFKRIELSEVDKKYLNECLDDPNF